MEATPGTPELAASAPLDSLSSSGRGSPHPTLPELPYSLRNHKKNIAIVWSLLALDTTIFPLALFYPLWYTHALIPAYIFAVTTSVFGLISGCEWAYRTWRLWREEYVRPVGGKRKWFDFFHFAYTAGYTISLIELIIGAAPFYPIVRLCAMPVPSFVIFFGIILFVFGLLDALGVKSIVRISSLPRGSRVRPGIYTIMEDVIAVDTGKGRKWREALNARYEASSNFRRMIRVLNWFWAIPALLIGGGTSAAVWIQEVPREVAYGIGWGVPPAWTVVWVAITIIYVQRCLKEEKIEWGKRKEVVA